MPYLGSTPAQTALTAAHIADGAVNSDEIATGAVDLAHLSASGTAGSGNFLRGDNSWQAAAQFANWSQSSGHLTPDNATYGIHLGVATATAANLLADYEEGTWTPALTFGGGATGISYTTQLGEYVKVGKMVWCGFYLRTSSNGSSTGATNLTGLPFTVSNTSTAAYGSSLVTNYRSGFSSDHYPGGYASKNGTHIVLVNLDPDDTGTSGLTDSDWTDSGLLYGSITYRSES